MVNERQLRFTHKIEDKFYIGEPNEYKMEIKDLIDV